MTYPGGGGGDWSPQNPQQNPQFGQQYGGNPPSGPQPVQGQPGQYPQTGQFPPTGPQPQQFGQQQPFGQQPHGQQPQFGQQPFGQQQFGQQPQYGQQPFGQQPKKKRTALVITSVVAVVALAAGTVATVWAIRSSDSAAAGAPSPAAAASNLMNSLGSGDVIGIMNGLAPAEAKLSKDYTEQTVQELKRLEILKPEADPNKVTGVEFKAEGITFDEGAAEQVNNHVTINKLTAGTITVTSDVRQIPLTDKLVDALGSEFDQQSPETETIDLAQKIRDENDGEPFRIATVKVGDEWYPSIFYTLADYALAEEGLKWPSTGIAAAGAGSAGDAAKQMIEAALDSDLEKVIALLPPDELGVLQDVGPVLVEQMGGSAPTGAKLLALETDEKEVTGGTLLTVKKLSVEADGEKVDVSRDGDCYTVAAQGDSQKLCADEVTQLIEQQGGSDLPPAAVDVMGRLASGLMQEGVGVVATEVDGKFYVSPFRTYSELLLTVVRQLEAKDVDELLKAAK
ncbi:DUF3824 domain-containing protein [Umezawaea beigongshangensis]|uniref:DUF3824 domain-containing protein n=1 Tax=Umezawaea beigongshangensis TaxID=2780383 RepID=UPI0018F226BE|nr:DUF3824 domain-containing protein [Umezawaea beigongshangensis]